MKKMTSFSVIVLSVITASCSAESGSLDQSEALVTVPDGEAQSDPSRNFDSSAFRMGFAQPKATDVAVQVGPEGLKVQVEPFNHAPTATWGLFRADKPNDISTAAPIFENLPVGVKEVTWATAAVPAGSYYLFVEGKSGEERSIFWLPTEIKVSNVTLDSPPEVIITSVVDQKVYGPGDTIEINYSAVYARKSPLTYSVFWSSDDGASWFTISENSTTSQASLAFDETFTQGARYKIRVDATSEDGKGSATNAGNFGFSAEAITFNTKVRDVVLAKCATSGCHDPAGGAGNFDATSWDDVQDGLGSRTGINSKKDLIFDRTRQDNNMPPAGSPQLTQEEKDLIALWNWSGYPR